jgi:hypothetical protein
MDRNNPKAWPAMACYALLRNAPVTFNIGLEIPDSAAALQRFHFNIHKRTGYRRSLSVSPAALAISNSEERHKGTAHDIGERNIPRRMIEHPLPMRDSQTHSASR